MCSYSVVAQEKLYVYQEDGTCTEFQMSDVESIALEAGIKPYNPDDVIFNKVFSINPVDRVLFSPGNLQYHPTKKIWRFAPEQTAHIGKGNENISSNYNDWIDLFGWGTGDDPTKSSTSYGDYSEYAEWGDNIIGEDASGTWRTLSHNEWEYLLKKRENASNLISAARVKGNNGVILLPDNWVCPEDVVLKTGFSGSDDGYSNHQVITASEWEKLEDAGAVFLPAAGYRSGTTVKGLQESCRYWAAYWHMTTSAAMFYSTARKADIAFTYSYCGQSVRLVSVETY